MNNFSLTVWKDILKKNKSVIYILLFISVISVFLNLFPAILTQEFIDRVLIKRKIELLLPAFLIIVVSFFLKELVRGLFEYIYQRRINKIVISLRNLLLKSVLNKTLTQYRSTDSTFNILINDINFLWSSGVHQIPQILFSLLIGVGAAIYLININVYFFLVAVAVTLITLLPIKSINKKQNILIEEAYIQELKQTNFVKDFFDKPLFIKTNYHLSYYRLKIQELADKLLIANLRRELNFRLFLVIRQFSDALLPAFIYGFGGWLYFNKHISLGEIIASVMLIGYITQPITQATQYYLSLKELLPRLSRINKELDMYNNESQKKKELNLNKEYQIEFQYVSFKANDTFILKELNFKVNKGEHCLLIGESGSGKTTIFNLLLGLMEPTAGKILISDQKIDSYSKHSLKNNISIVPQESMFFTGTIKDNLLIVNENATLEEIERALYVSSSIDFIEALPSGVESLLEENANNLSGGQRQRLAIARSLLKNPKILLLDEALSALDPPTANRVLDRICAYEDITLLHITHRIDLKYSGRVINISGQKSQEG